MSHRLIYLSFHLLPDFSVLILHPSVSFLLPLSRYIFIIYHQAFCFTSVGGLIRIFFFSVIRSSIFVKVHRSVPCLEKAVAPHSQYSCLENPWTEEPGGLQSMGSRRVRHNWATSLSLFSLMHWRRKWQPTPVFLPGESQGPGSLVGCHLWGHTESDTTEVTWQQQQQFHVRRFLFC